MNNGFTTKAVSMRLKELGFDERTWTFYQNGNESIQCNGRLMDYNEFTDCQSAPTWTEAGKWLHGKYDMWIEFWPTGLSAYTGIPNLVPSQESDSFKTNKTELAFTEAMEGLKK